MDILNHLSALASYQQLLTHLQAGKTMPGLGLPRATRLPIGNCGLPEAAACALACADGEAAAGASSTISLVRALF